MDVLDRIVLDALPFDNNMFIAARADIIVKC